ncbi:hypothetical protein FNH22_21730 [Fulvivirga sp. M361]|uniref:hypothetical protein n=1 Tax=Fulvivirga sp. M361 TaxID=2594266 RepID=UPI001179DDFB|nr:hypothetical protein [Fulvivirga sp. M361]TRX52672.1 hypothetical protein FNH22_21730 [Fulvivirga sp. M361]
MVNSKNLFLLVIAITWMNVVVAQEESNLEKYTPSVLLEKGKWEINSFYNLYTQTKVRDREGDEVSLGQRQTFLNAMYQFTYGVGQSGRVNIGFDVWATSALYDDEDSNPLKVLLFSGGDFNRTAVTGIGPRIRYVPFKSINGFSVQSTFLFPVAEDLETPFFTAHDRYTWFTQFFYDLKLNSSWRLFLEADFLYRIKRNDNQVNFFRTPLSGFISYFPSSRTTIFLNVQYAPRFERISNEQDETFGLNNWFTQIGGGIKYQLKPKLGIELSYGNFVGSRQDGAGYALNLGFRYIR